MKKLFSVPDISCGHCVARIREGLDSSNRIHVLEISLEEKTVALETELPSESILSILEDAGYPAVEISG